MRAGYDPCQFCKARHALRTTNSRHSLPVFRNLVKDMELTGPNQELAADITYIRTDGGSGYPAIIHDKWSQKITGRMRTALEDGDGARGAGMAQAGLKEGEHPVHHGDRGCQYCSHDYVAVPGRPGYR